VTIGIAAHGPEAGCAILTSLRSIEAFATGAIGGFVSVAGLGSDGSIHRAEIQNGGARALLDQGRVSELLLSARSVVLMSSGPNRPEPLSQFTPALAGVGLVTGHRFPNNRGRDGRSLAESVLAAMTRGETPHDAVQAVVRSNPHADAGLIALSADGEIFAADTSFMARFGDRGGAFRESVDGTTRVAILHNGIEPSENLGSLLAELIVKAMTPSPLVAGTVELCAGTPVSLGDEAGLVLSETGDLETTRLVDNAGGRGVWSCGIGYLAPVWRSGRQIGHCLDEPFLVSDGGKLISVNGRTRGFVRWTSVE